MNRRNPIYLAGFTVALGTIFCGCSKPAPEEKAEPIAPVQAGPVGSGTIRRLVIADGVLQPINQSTVVPKITAPVRKFDVNRGDHVKAGQVVAVLENRDLAAAVAAAKGQVDQAEANLRGMADATVPDQVTKAETDVDAAKEQQDAAQKVVDNRKALVQEGALAQKLLDDANVALAQAKAQYRTAVEHLKTLQTAGKESQVNGARAQVVTARSQLQQAEAQLAFTEVPSLISGVVADRPMFPGDIAQPGTPMMTIVDISSVKAVVNVPQGQAMSVKVGQPAKIKVPEQDDEIDAKVSVVSPSTDPASTTVQVWVQMANPGERMKPGTNVHVSIVTEVIPNATIVPLTAILQNDEGKVIVDTVGADNTIHQKEVEVGVREPDKVQITKGVSPGDQIVTVGGVGLDDNAKIRIVKPGAEDEEPPAEPAPAAGAKKAPEKK